MYLYERLGDRQAEPGPPSAGPAVEQVEDQFSLLRRYPWAGVGDGELDLVGVSASGHGFYDDLGSRRAVPGSVLEQVRQRLGDERRVHLEGRKVLGDDPSQARGVERGLDQRGGLINEVVYHDRLAFWPAGPGFESPKLEHGAHKARQAVGLLLDRLQEVAAGCFSEHDPWLSQV